MQQELAKHNEVAKQELVWRKGDERCERSYRETPKIVPTEKKARARRWWCKNTRQ